MRVPCVVCVLKTFTEEVLTHQTDLHNITTCAKRFFEFAKVTEFSCFDINLHFRFCWIHTFYLDMVFVTVCSAPALSYIFMALFVNDKKTVYDKYLFIRKQLCL